MEIDLTNAVLFADSNRGQYIPQHFAESINRECLEGISETSLKTLEAGPDHDWYWEEWETVLSNAIVTMPESGMKYWLNHDGDLWLVPVDV